MKMNEIDLFVVRPALTYLDLHRGREDLFHAARHLMLATCAPESKGEHIDQRLSASDVQLGPALGLFQMELWVFDDLRINGLNQSNRHKLNMCIAQKPDLLHQLATNLFLQAVACRLQYYRFPDRLPPPGDRHGMWRMYKKRWNSAEGATTEDKFMAHWDQYVVPLL